MPTGTPEWFLGFARLAATWEGVSTLEWSGMPAVAVNGNPFAAVWDVDLVVRVDAAARERALSRPSGRPFDGGPEGTKLSRDWIQLAVPSSAADRFSEEWGRIAFDFCRNLPPRAARPEASAPADARRKKPGAKRK
ncbi:MAG: hypothetical protein L0216_00525 [Planctomycetales bacterium]|nr:hypothetical protein [Planctomycetales bacterium]